MINMKAFCLAFAFFTGCHAFLSPSRTFVNPQALSSTTGSSSARFLGLDPTSFHDISQQLHSMQDVFTSFNLADALDADAVSAAVDSSNAVSATATDAAATAAADAAANQGGWFGFLTGPIEGLLQIIHSVLVAVGLSEDAWGVSIIMMTVIIKVLTFPLTKTQLESTNKMQAMQPAIKELQAKYQSNPEVMNQKIAEFYQANEINPLAGCLPSLVQIPVFIGLYRAVLQLAKDNKLDEPFLWLPNLEGPTYGADPTHGSDWILSGWVNGAPSLGWPDTIAFLSLPLFLVLSQFVSMQLMQPKSDDPAQQQSNLILKLLPLMIGWFSLNVPAALCIYWVVNNIITTATSLIIRNSMKVEPVTLSSSGAASARSVDAPSIFAPPREKPAGFGGATPSFSASDVKPITVMDAEVVDEDDDIEGDDGADVAGDDAQPRSISDSASSKKKSAGKRRGKKRKN